MYGNKNIMVVILGDLGFMVKGKTMDSESENKVESKAIKIRTELLDQLELIKFPVPEVKSAQEKINFVLRKWLEDRVGNLNLKEI